MKHEEDLGVIKTLIVILIIMNIILVPKVLMDITQTGTIMKQTSPDGKYELIINRDKYPTLDAYGEFFTITLYDKKSGMMISSLEQDNITDLARHPEITITWLEAGVYIDIDQTNWSGYYNSAYILPYEKQNVKSRLDD